MKCLTFYFVLDCSHKRRSALYGRVRLAACRSLFLSNRQHFNGSLIHQCAWIFAHLSIDVRRPLEWMCTASFSRHTTIFLWCIENQSISFFLQPIYCFYWRSTARYWIHCLQKLQFMKSLKRAALHLPMWPNGWTSRLESMWSEYFGLHGFESDNEPK